MTDRRINIVVADDDAMARLGYRAILECAGLSVHVAQDGDEATRLVEKGGVDAVLLDILMPRKEGLETLLEIKRRFPKLIVVMMTAGGVRSEFDFLAVAARLGADKTLHKPLSQHDLITLAEELKAMAGANVLH